MAFRDLSACLSPSFRGSNVTTVRVGVRLLTWGVVLGWAWLAMPAATTTSAGEPAPSARSSMDDPHHAIAITIDDLPFVNAVRPGDSKAGATERILSALRRHDVPATGFVVCDRIAGQESILEQWRAAGLELGNHSCSHPHLDRINLDSWRIEVCSCSNALAGITGRPVRWFRYPFLQTGSIVARRDSALGIVTACGHEVAPVSVDTGEWALVKPYVDAWRAGDSALAGQVGDAYVTHLLAAIDHYRDVAEARFGRNVPHVLLLHANALAADYLDTLLTAIKGRGFDFVTLADALMDSVYALPDGYAGPIGLSWLYRVNQYLEGAWSWDNAQVSAFEQRFQGRSDADSFRIDRDLLVRQLGGGIWTVTHAGTRPDTSTVAELADSTLLMVNTPSTSAATRSLLSWLSARLGRRTIIAALTNAGHDRRDGTEALREAGIPIVW